MSSKLAAQVSWPAGGDKCQGSDSEQQCGVWLLALAVLAVRRQAAGGRHRGVRVQGCRNPSWRNTTFRVNKTYPYIITTFRRLLSLHQISSLHNDGL